MNPRFSPKRCRRAAFTLTETLVVAAVLLVLISLVAGFSQRTLAKADEAVCLNNLRQLGSALQLYAGEHDMKYPATQFYFSGHAGVIEAIAPYVQDSVDAWYCRRYLKYFPDRNARQLYGWGEMGYYYWAFNNSNPSLPLSASVGTSAWTEQGYTMPPTGHVLLSDVFGDKTYWGGPDDVQMHAGDSHYKTLGQPGTLVFTTSGCVEKVAPKRGN